MHQLQKAKFQVKPLLLLIGKLAVCAQYNLQKASQVFFTEKLCHTRDALPLVR